MGAGSEYRTQGEAGYDRDLWCASWTASPCATVQGQDQDVPGGPSDLQDGEEGEWGQAAKERGEALGIVRKLIAVVREVKEIHAKRLGPPGAMLQSTVQSSASASASTLSSSS